MILQDYLFLVVYLVLLGVMSLITSQYSLKLRGLNNNIKDSEYVIQSIISELRNRAKAQDNRLLDHEVKIEILELKVGKQFIKKYDILSQNDSKHEIERSIEVVKDDNKENIDYSKQLISKQLTETELKVLSYLKGKDYSVKELQLMINRTREHTARILQKLNVEGLIERSERRPYRYKIKS